MRRQRDSCSSVRLRRRLELLLASRGLSLADRLTTLNSLAAMIANISAGLGCGYLPRSIVERYLRNGLMCEYPVDNPYSRLNVVFIYRRDHVQDAAFRYFLEMLRDRIDSPVVKNQK